VGISCEFERIVLTFAGKKKTFARKRYKNVEAKIHAVALLSGWDLRIVFGSRQSGNSQCR